MNRTTVVFLAIALLLAHTFAIHQTPLGEFAAPYERAHVAYRLGRNLVFDGAAAWEVGQHALAAYPSVLWVALAAVAEWFHVFPTDVAQTVGILSALATIIVLAQFSSNRLAGLIAPLLLAASGAAAAGAASGTEAPLAMLFLTAAFLAFERGFAKPLIGACVLLALTRPEGATVPVMLLVLELVDRPRDPEIAPRRSLVRPLLVTLAILAAVIALRGVATDVWLSPSAAAVLAPDGDRLALGGAYLLGFLVASGSAPVLLLPVIFALTRRLPGRGRRALLSFLGWCAAIAWIGGDELPYWNALVPALPLGFLAIQSAITHWIDHRPKHAPVAFTVIASTLLVSLLSSKLPGDLGPIPMTRFIEAWMRPSPTLARAYPEPLARAGLLRELREVETLRSVGVFLRDKVDADARIGTFWPGAIGYLTHKEVVDLLGRTAPIEPGTPSTPWSGWPRTDLVARLSEPYDYLVLTIDPKGSVADVLGGWLASYDVVGNSPERLRELNTVLRNFEVVSVPVPASADDPNAPSNRPFLMLRSVRRRATPTVELVVEGERFHVDVHHRGHRQVVDLTVEVVDQAGVRWRLSPTGTWTSTEEVDARTNLLVYSTGTTPIRMLSASLPPDVHDGALSAYLHSPGIPDASLFAKAGVPATARIGGS